MSATVPAAADLAALPYPAVPDGAVALLPIGSVEAHGPHLPLSTDTDLALAAARRAAARLSASGRHALVLPALPYGVCAFAAAFPGTIGISPDALAATIRDLCAAAAARFAAVAIVNLHFDPGHVAAVARAVAGLPRVAFPDLRRHRHAARLGDEFLSGACHAGRFETSLMLAAEPARVGDRDLPRLEVSLSDAIARGARTFGEIGMDRAYTGAPAEASAAEGERLLDEIAAIVVESLAEVLP